MLSFSLFYVCKKGADKGPQYLVDDIVMTGDDPETIS